MKHLSIIKIGTVLGLTLAMAIPAHAQFGNLKKAIKKEAVKQAVQEVEKEIQKSSTPAPATPVPTSTTATTVSHSPQMSGAPAANLRALTTCASLKPSNIVIGKLGDYTFQQGMSSESRSGLIGRRSAQLSDGCILPSLNPREVVYMEVDSSAMRAMGSSNDWEMQCVRSANPSAGVVGATQGFSEYPHNVNFLSGKAMMLHCGNSEGVTECATGSNSSRSGAWKKKVDSRSATMLSFYATPSTLAPAGGEKLYCQYYNKTSGSSLFAFEYLRTQN